MVGQWSEAFLHAPLCVDVADDEEDEQRADQAGEDDPFDDIARVRVASPVVAHDVVAVAVGAAREWW